MLLSQDYIVKSNRDTIFCKILNEGELELKYIQPGSSDQSIKKIKYSEISYYSIDKKTIDSIKPAGDYNTPLKLPKKKGLDRVFRASFSYGFGKWYCELPVITSTKEKDYFDRLTKGKAMELDLAFIIDHSIGFSISYASLSTKSDFTEYLQTQQYGAPSLTTFYEDITLTYFGASFFVLVPTNSNINILLGAGPGKLFLKDELTTSGIYLVGTGSDLAIRLIGNVEYMVSDIFSIHIGASFVSSKISSLEIDGTDYDFDNNTRHIKLTAGIALSL